MLYEELRRGGTLTSLPPADTFLGFFLPYTTFISALCSISIPLGAHQRRLGVCASVSYTIPRASLLIVAFPFPVYAATSDEWCSRRWHRRGCRRG